MQEQIRIIIKDEIQQQPRNVKCTITHTYPDKKHADIHTTEYGDLQYIECIGTPTENNTGVLIFLNNSYDEKIIITHGGTNE